MPTLEPAMRNALALLLTLFIFANAKAAPGEAAVRDSLTDIAPKQATLAPVSRIAHKAINECSGLAFMGGAYWTHNDSGAEAVVYRSTTPDFSDSQAFEVNGADAEDWEELAVLEGDLLIFDTGDNHRAREKVSLYRVRYEPNTRTLLRAATYHITYPDGAHDCEGVCVIDGKVHLFVKNRGEKTTGVFRCDTLDAAKVNTPVLAGELEIEKGEQITAADISGDTVVLLTYTHLYQYKKDNLSGAPLKSTRLGARQCEALCFAGNDLYFANEQRDVYRIENFLKRDYESTLPVLGKATLNVIKDAAEVDGSGESWANFRTEVTLDCRMEDEHLRWVIAGDCLMLHARLRYEGEFQSTRENDLGSGLLLCFGKERRLKSNDDDVLLLLGDNGQTGLDCWRLDNSGKEIKLKPLTGCKFKGTVKNRVMEFEASLPLKSLLGGEVPEAFLFNAFGLSMHTRDEVLFSGLDFFALFRPYLWGDVTVKK